MVKDAFYGNFAGMDTVRDADATVAVTRQRQAGVFFESSIDFCQLLRVTKIILRHSFFPNKSSSDERLGCNAKCEFEFFAGQFEQTSFIPRDVRFLPGATDKDTDRA